MSDLEAQEDELLALASIYDNLTFSTSEDGGQFYASVDLPQPFHVKITKEADDIIQPVSYLPPLGLFFQLPDDYPSSSPPNYTLSCKWLTRKQLSSLCKRLDDLWEESKGEVILFLWTSFLKDETLSHLNITPPLDLSRVVPHRSRHPSRRHHSGSSEKSNGAYADTAAVTSTSGPSASLSGGQNPHSGATDLPDSSRTDEGQCDKDSKLSYASGGSAAAAESGATASYPAGASAGPAAGDTFGDRRHDGNESVSGNDIPAKSVPYVDDFTQGDVRAIQDIASQELLLPAILEYNKDQEEHVFQTTLYTCQVCFGEKMGKLCLKFSGCGHVYCKECMAGYFQVQISDGSVMCLTCPYDQCESQAHPAQVKELVGQDLFSRYERLLLQSSLDTMSDIMYCPRQSCGCPVMVDEKHNMGTCPACHLVFCVFCKHVYHGVSPCRIKADEIKKLRESYMLADEGEKRAMDRRYGRRAMMQVMEDSFSEEWLEQHSKRCPHCSTHIQKIDGCNKMTCTKCRSFFCWLCMQLLSRSNPYGHFNSIASPCFNRLFQGVAIDDDEGDSDEEFFLVQM